MTVLERQVTTEEFEIFLQRPENQERLFELIHGEIVEKMATEEHGVMALNIGALLRAFVKQQNLDRVGVEIRHQLPKDHYNARLPDVSFISGARPVTRKGGLPQMPDLAVEVQSPDDSIKKMRDKASYYLANGCRMVWLVFPAKRYLEVYQPDSEMEVMLGNDLLTGGDLLPGFAMSVADVFDGV